jgi:hypothetical protein
VAAWLEIRPTIWFANFVDEIAVRWGRGCSTIMVCFDLRNAQTELPIEQVVTLIKQKQHPDQRKTHQWAARSKA